MHQAGGYFTPICTSCMIQLDAGPKNGHTEEDGLVQYDVLSDSIWNAVMDHFKYTEVIQVRNSTIFIQSL